MTTPPSPPPGWYPDPSGTPNTRYWDGQQWGPAAPSTPPPAVAPAAPPKKKTSTGRIIAIIAAVFVGLIILGSIGNHDKQPTTSTSTSSASTPGSSAETPKTPSSTSKPVASIGQEVRDGQFAFTVVSVDRSKQAGDLSNQFEIVTAQGEFLNVHMTVANTGNHAQSFFATNQHLKIGGKTYDANGMAALWTSSANEEVNPGNSIQVVVSFDVPPGASGGTLQLHDSAFSGGVQVGLP